MKSLVEGSGVLQMASSTPWKSRGRGGLRHVSLNDPHVALTKQVSMDLPTSVQHVSMAANTRAEEYFHAQQCKTLASLQTSGSKVPGTCFGGKPRPACPGHEARNLGHSTTSTPTRTHTRSRRVFDSTHHIKSPVFRFCGTRPESKLLVSTV